MRIVPNLNDINECPNCKRLGLIRITNEFGRPFKQCQICHEEVIENETTCSVYYVKETADAKEEQLKQKQKEKENFIFEMRGEISHLTWSIHDARSMVLVQNIQNILNRIIDYIEEN